MLILAAPMVSQLHNCTRERLKENFLFDFVVAIVTRRAKGEFLARKTLLLRLLQEYAEPFLLPFSGVLLR